MRLYTTAIFILLFNIILFNLQPVSVDDKPSAFLNDEDISVSMSSETSENDISLTEGVWVFSYSDENLPNKKSCCTMPKCTLQEPSLAILIPPPERG